MSILNHYGLSSSHKYTFLIVSIAATIILALLFDYLTGKLNKAIWKERRPDKQLNGGEE